MKSLPLSFVDRIGQEPFPRELAEAREIQIQNCCVASLGNPLETYSELDITTPTNAGDVAETTDGQDCPMPIEVTSSSTIYILVIIMGINVFSVSSLLYRYKQPLT